MTLPEAILLTVQIWAGFGGLVALAFLTVGIDRVDEDARGAYVFRPLLIPGILLVWPLVLWRWYVSESDREKWRNRYNPPRKSHLIIGVILPVAIVAIFAVTLAQRQVWPGNIAPQQMHAAEGADQ
jgi:hypothetical protein